MEKYEQPVFEVIELDAEDVIITSCVSNEHGNAGVICMDDGA